MGVGCPVIGGGLDVAELKGLGGVPVKAPLVVIVQRGEGLLAGDAGRQPPCVAAVDELGGIGYEVDGQAGVAARENVRLPHQDHRT
ncbi:Uncharacterised protein [Mycobacteroides abscessus subsp. abscessus]|nr:Uncharacterised protein [Mycobacteroides abscessus subsp. abscessus]